MIDIDDDNFLSEELVQRALTCIRLAGPGEDFLDAFSKAASQLELQPHIRVLRLQLPAWFKLLHPRVVVRLLILRRVIRHAAHTKQRSGAHRALTNRCQNLLDDVEIRLHMPANLQREARQLADQCFWILSQSRSALFDKATVAASSLLDGAALTKSNPVLVCALGAGILFLGLAVLTTAYGISHFFRCASMDCVFIGAIQVSWLSFTVGLIIGWHCWIKIRLHHDLHARMT